MHRLLPAIMATLALTAAMPIFCQTPFTENLVANGNFNLGDLTGWTEAGPQTIPSWHGAPPVPAQVFSNSAPMHVTEIRYYEQGDRHIVRTAIAYTVKAYDEYSVGWTHSGATTMGYPWISQVIRVAPGTYLANASWRVVAGHEAADVGKFSPKQYGHSSREVSAIPSKVKPGADFQNSPKTRKETNPPGQSKTSTTARTIGGALIINTDKDINAYSDKGSVLTSIVWNDESQGKWLLKSANDLKITTLTGYIEVRLQLCVPESKYLVFDRFKQSTSYDYVAFDDVVLQLTPVEPQETQQSTTETVQQ
jgi:hypothetical protein